MKKIAFIFMSLCVFQACSFSEVPMEEAVPEFTTQYHEYSDYTRDLALEKGPTLLYFSADWCPTCRHLTNELKTRINEFPENISILELNYDTETELKQKWKVNRQHTLIQLDQEGNEVTRWSGGGVETIKENLNIESKKNATTDSKVIVNDVKLQNDFKGAKIKKADLLQGCPRQDCIPSIDKPDFESVTQGDTWLNDEDIVFAINRNGVERAYAQRILNWHEIVNDKIGDEYVAITFCPLCGSALAFDRTVDGIITEFGVSGKLHDSDLVMYDRYEGNLWQQISGEAIVGPAARRDEKLKSIPIVTTTWGQWKSEHPNTEVLSTNTGHFRDYSRYPYGTYESDGELYFGVENLDETLQIKTVIYGVEINGESRAYPESTLQEAGLTGIQDTLGGESIALSYNNNGSVSLISTGGIDKTAEFNPPIRLFWFAWAAFHPDTTIYK